MWKTLGEVQEEVKQESGSYLKAPPLLGLSVNYTCDVRIPSPPTLFRPRLDSSGSAPADFRSVTKYSRADWRRLGAAVHAARMQKGYRDTTSWASVIERSTRTALGIERGEAVGSDTLERIETALGWRSGYAHVILVSGSMPESAEPQVSGVAMPEASDAELLSELLQRALRRESARASVTHLPPVHDRKRGSDQTADNYDFPVAADDSRLDPEVPQ